MLVKTVRDYAKRGDALSVPDLVEVQQAAYNRFLQQDKPFDGRDLHMGLEGLLREVFPIESYDESMGLEYLYYELDEPRYTPEECRELRLTYGMPFRIGVRLRRKDKDEILEEEIYLGEIPVMIGGGEFIINGAERVIVNQLHRSPGVDFSIAVQRPTARCTGPRHPRARLVDRAGGDQEGRPGSAHRPVQQDPRHAPSCAPWTRSTPPTKRIAEDFYNVETVKVDELKPEHYAAAPIIDTESGEELVKAGGQIGEHIEQIMNSPLDKRGCHHQSRRSADPQHPR